MRYKNSDEITYDYSINGDNDGTFVVTVEQNCRGLSRQFFKLRKSSIKYLSYLDGWFVNTHTKKWLN
jgi:hypothetical protein